MTITRTISLVGLLVLLQAGALPSADLTRDGVIIGKVEPPDVLRSIAAVDRQTKQTVTGQIDRRHGAFRIAGLIVGRRYDLVLETTLGRIEGADMSVEPTDSSAAASRPATKPASRAFTDADRDAIKRLVAGPQRFADEVRILLLAGVGDRAAVLVEKLRTRPFHQSKPDEIVWRVELWYFAWWYGGWAKQPHTQRVLYRRRMQRSELDRTNWVFTDKLGGVIARRSDDARRVSFRIPGKLNPTNGRVAQP